MMSTLAAEPASEMVAAPPNVAVEFAALLAPEDAMAVERVETTADNLTTGLGGPTEQPADTRATIAQSKRPSKTDVGLFSNTGWLRARPQCIRRQACARKDRMLSMRQTTGLNKP